MFIKNSLKEPFNIEQIVGIIPTFLNLNEPGTAAEQIDQYYISGWNPIKGFELANDNATLLYPGDPPLEWYCFTLFREEIIYFYMAGFVMIKNTITGYWEVARLD